MRHKKNKNKKFVTEIGRYCQIFSKVGFFNSLRDIELAWLDFSMQLCWLN